MDRLRLNPVSQRHVTAGSCAGVWLIGCEPVDGTVRYCRECGGMGRVRSSWRRRFVHMPVGQHAVHLLVRVRRYECMCFASMFVRQVRQCFSAVWADGFPRCRHRFPVM